MTPDFTTFLLTAPAHEQPRDEHEKLVMEIAYRQGFSDGKAEAILILGDFVFANRVSRS